MAKERDEIRRQTLQRLLAEEEAKLTELDRPRPDALEILAIASYECFPRWSLVMTSVKLAVAGIFVFASIANAQDVKMAAPTPKEHQTDSFMPDLGDIMAVMQLRHLKLAFAGSLENWKLAGYEIAEMQKSFETAAKVFPKFETVPVAKLIDDVSEPALREMKKPFAPETRRPLQHPLEVSRQLATAATKAQMLGSSLSGCRRRHLSATKCSRHRERGISAARRPTRPRHSTGTA